jgi:hypothetical protein
MSLDGSVVEIAIRLVAIGGRIAFGQGRKENEPKLGVSARWRKNLATTYSRGSYTTTTIGKAAFDGRVRNGIGSVHSFMTTKNCFIKNRMFSENYTQANFLGFYFYSRVKKCLVAFFNSIEEKKAIKPHDRLVLVR